MPPQRALAAAAGVALILASACTPRLALSMIIRGGTLILDGEHERVSTADLGISGDRIIAIGDLSKATAPIVIDAAGRIVAPGFIDIEGHAGVGLLSDPLARAYLEQGVTTEVLGGDTPAYWTPDTADAEQLRCAGVTFDWQGPEAFMTRLEQRGPGLNVALLAPLSAAARAATDVATFANREYRRGVFGLSADAATAPDDVMAAVRASQTLGGVVEFSWAATRAGNLAPIVSSGARFHGLVTRTWSEPEATVTDQAAAAARVSSAAALPPDRVAASGDGDRLPLDSLLFTAATGPVTCDTNGAAAGAIPRVFDTMVRTRHVMSVARAVHRLTRVPRLLLDLYQRGEIAKDFFADLVIFDPERIGAHPSTAGSRPPGIDYVIVNGVITVGPNGPTGARAGYVLRRRVEPVVH